MTSLLIAFEILFVILIANLIEPAQQQRLRRGPAQKTANSSVLHISRRTAHQAIAIDKTSSLETAAALASYPDSRQRARAPESGGRATRHVPNFDIPRGVSPNSSLRAGDKPGPWPIEAAGLARGRARDKRATSERSGLVAASSSSGPEPPARGDESTPGSVQRRRIVAASDTQPESSAADLCYLANGGSSLTLTVNEATQVGSVIGTVDVSMTRCSRGSAPAGPLLAWRNGQNWTAANGNAIQTKQDDCELEPARPLITGARPADCTRH
jgi:hypothetical protein